MQSIWNYFMTNGAPCMHACMDHTMPCAVCTEMCAFRFNAIAKDNSTNKIHKRHCAGRGREREKKRGGH